MITLHPTKLVVRGPRVDGGYSITLELGEYDQDAVAEVVRLPHELPIDVVISTTTN